jgi:hypothetical protein
MALLRVALLFLRGLLIGRAALLDEDLALCHP